MVASFLESTGYGLLNDVLGAFRSDDGHALPNRYEIEIGPPLGGVPGGSTGSGRSFLGCRWRRSWGALGPLGIPRPTHDRESERVNRRPRLPQAMASQPSLGSLRGASKDAYSPPNSTKN